MSLFNWLFGRRKQRIIIDMMSTLTAGKVCPQCHVEGLFYYSKKDGYSMNFYRCEECNTQFYEDKTPIEKK